MKRLVEYFVAHFALEWHFTCVQSYVCIKLSELLIFLLQTTFVGFLACMLLHVCDQTTKIVKIFVAYLIFIYSFYIFANVCLYVCFKLLELLNFLLHPSHLEGFFACVCQYMCGKSTRIAESFAAHYICMNSHV